MHALEQEIRSCLRKLLRSPLFATLSVVLLALGIGANTAIFSVIHGVLLRPLPYADPERLVGVWHEAPGLGFEQVNQSAATYFTYREQGRVFEDIALWDNDLVSVTGGSEPEQVEAMMVTDGLFPLVGVKPQIGRLFSAEDDSPGAAETVVLSDAYWQQRFGGDTASLGTTLTVDGRPREVIGVLPAGFRMLRFAPDIYYPPQFDRSQVTMGQFNYQGMARLRPGTTIEEANADVERLVPVAAEIFPGGITLSMLEQARFGADVHPLEQDVVGDIGQVLWVLFGTVGLVLLIACANVANLFLVRAETRQREMALRTALGAGRGALARHFLLESVLLALLGGAVGVALAAGVLRLLVLLAPPGLPRLEEIGLHPPVLLFSLALSLLAGVFFGTFPVARFRAVQLASALKDGGRGSGIGRQRHAVRNALVVVQVALALVLLVGSGLMVRSFQALRSVHPGFEEPAEVLTFRVTIPAAEIEEPALVAQAHESILRALEGLPGVDSAGASSSVTMDGRDSNDALFVEDFPTEEGQLPPIRRFKFIAGDYFATLRNPLLAGRSIDWADLHEQRRVAMVTENFARDYWRDAAAALGKRIGTLVPGSGGGAGAEESWSEIVGVVANERDDGVSQEPPAVVYWPMASRDVWQQGLRAERSLVFVLRSDRAKTRSLLSEARQAVWSVNGNLPVANARTLDEILDRSLSRTSFTLLMLAIAAAVAVLLGSVGIYGVLSYIVSQRTQEIGVRMALGARRRDVSHQMARHGILLSVTGVGVGLLAAVVLTRFMSSLLYGVAPVDLLTFGTVAATLGCIALVASYVAGRRAAGVDPIAALRAE